MNSILPAPKTNADYTLEATRETLTPILELASRHKSEQLKKERGKGLADLFGIDKNDERFEKTSKLLGGMQDRDVIELYKTHSAQQAKKQTPPAVTQGQQAVKNMVQVLNRGNIGKGNLYNKFSASGRQDRAYFDRLALNLEKLGAEMVGKGALTQARFEYLKSRLPSSDNTDATNRGILRGWAEDLGMDLAELGFDDMVDEQASAPGNAPIDVDVVMLRDPSGALRKVSKKDEQAAIKAGYQRAQ